MWFVELENMGEASWAICREQGPEGRGQVYFDGQVLLRGRKKKAPRVHECRDQDFSPNLCPLRGCVLPSVTLGGREGSSHET